MPRRSELVVGVGLVALLPALLGAVVFFRFDLWPALLVSLSLLALERRRNEVAAGLLGLAVATKLYAAALVPPFLSFVDREGGRHRVRRASAALVAAVLLVTMPLAVVAPGGVASSLQRQFDRPLQIESTGASLLLVAGDPTVAFGSGSWNLTGAVPTAIGVVSTIAGLGALAGVWILVWKRRRSLSDAALVYAACIAIVLVFGKVASPQFLVWLAPLVAVVRGRTGLAACALCAGACVLTRLVYPVRYEELLTGDLLPAAAPRSAQRAPDRRRARSHPRARPAVAAPRVPRPVLRSPARSCGRTEVEDVPLLGVVHPVRADADPIRRAAAGDDVSTKTGARVVAIGGLMR